MPVELTLRYGDYSLKLHFKTNTYYTQQKFKSTKTMYQILFEHLINQTPISYNEIAERYQKVNPALRDSTVRALARKITDVAKISPDERLRKMKFVIKEKYRGQVPRRVMTVIEELMRNLHEGGRRPTYAEIRAAGITKLATIDPNIKIDFSGRMIRRLKRKLNLPRKPYKLRRLRRPA